MKYKSPNGQLIAWVEPDNYAEKGWLVRYTFRSGNEGIRCPFPSKRAAQSWAKGYVNDPANL